MSCGRACPTPSLPSLSLLSMDGCKEKNAWISVPQFGGWDHKTGAPDYSMVFSRARANRKQVKTDINRTSIGHEEELIAHQREASPARRRNIISYFNCCRA